MDKFEDKTLKKGWGERKASPEYDTYKEKTASARRLGWQETKRKPGLIRAGKKYFWPVVLIALISAIFYFYYFAAPVFDKNAVRVSVTGPKTISSGDLVSFKAFFRNDSGIPLKNAKVVFEWPEGSSFEGIVSPKTMQSEKTLGILMPNQEKILIFEGRIYGEKADVKKIKVMLNYNPGETADYFENNIEFEMGIGTIPVFLNVIIPTQVASDKESEIKVEYVNQSEASFSDMEIRAEYPSSFEFISSDPNPAVTNNNIWQLGTVEGKESNTLTIKGKFKGKEGERQLVSLDIGQSEKGGEFISFANSLAETQLASAALMVFQTANGSRDTSVNWGDVVSYKISYKNTTDNQISNTVIVAQVDEDYVDIKSLNIPWGSFDGRTNSIIWNQSGVPDLAVLDPKEEGYVGFSVRLKPEFAPSSVSDKNLEVKTVAKIFSGSLPEDLSGLPIEHQDDLTVKINTILGFKVNSYYSDGPVKNFGPLPPKVGEETSYAVSWQIVNTTNDVKDVEVSATIPPNIKWTGSIDPPDAGISYDKERGLIVWKPGIVFAGSGFFIPSQRVDFQLSFLPAPVHIGQTFNLISKATMKGSDVFTGTELSRVIPAIDSTLGGSISQALSRVIQ